jgi:hypothetical protein
MLACRIRSGAVVAIGLAVLALTAPGARGQHYCGCRPTTYMPFRSTLNPRALSRPSEPFSGSARALNCSPSRHAMFGRLAFRSPGYAPQPLSSPYGPAYGSTPYQAVEDPLDGYLRGVADVTNAQAFAMIAQQEAGLTHERALQAGVDTRRRTLDEWRYERDNLPTLEDERERSRREEVRRSRNDPPFTEIWSGKALNDLLAELQKRQARGASLPETALEDDLLRRVNVTAGRGAGIGPLKGTGDLHWPLALRRTDLREERSRFADLTEQAAEQVRQGQVDAGTLKGMSTLVERLQQRLAREVGTLPPPDYIAAKRFLTELDQALKVLPRPEARQHYSEQHAAQGKDVPDLVRHMGQHGLKFAPASAGDETAYLALHRAMSAYDPGPTAQLSAGR